MKILLATGIYPPDIGGPATYVRHLAEELSAKGIGVRVLTYSDNSAMDMKRLSHGWQVIGVPRSGGPLMRWFRYAKALKEHGEDADIVYAFSSISCGLPLRLAGLKGPKRILRLGGDFFWERYTDYGGKKTLSVWHQSYLIPLAFVRLFEVWILRTFHHIVFSTHLQQEILEQHFRFLPEHTVIENALLPGPPPVAGRGEVHKEHEPFRLLFMGRFVGFKNLPRLLLAVAKLPWITLTIVGDGPFKKKLRHIVRTRGLESRVKFRESVHGAEKKEIFADHDLLVLPSLTEISPNVALEARAHGLPVLLTADTGLSPILTRGMILHPMQSVAQITQAIQKTVAEYSQVADGAASPPTVRPWSDVADEHMTLFQRLS